MSRHVVSRPLLILDLDETLIRSTQEPLDRLPDFRVGPFHVYRRPHLEDFVRYCDSVFEVAVWTSASRDYAHDVVRQVFGCRVLRFVWCSERCTARTRPETTERYYVKDLRKVARLGIRLERVLMVDDSPEKLERNYGNHVWIRPFEGDPSDGELPRLCRYLEVIRGSDNFRALEKRSWWTRI